MNPRTITIALSCEGAGWLTKGRTLAPGLSGGATAICGASAALAIAAALPNHPQKERAILFTVFGISALSSFAMIAYPMLAHAVGLDARQAGVFLGATIHDVAQVVGAGYSISPETGDVATFVKLLRVATLMPVIAITVMSYRHAGGEVGAKRPPPLPGLRRRVRRLCVVAQPEYHPDQRHCSGIQRIAMVPGCCRRGARHQDAPSRVRHHRIQTDCADDRRDLFPYAARVGTVARQVLKSS
jgi:Conserved hypothetical protein 698